MKKIVYSIFALATSMFVASCSNDAIDIETTGQLAPLTCNIKTQNVYDEFNMKSDITSIMSEKKWGIGVYTYVYNENGVAVDSAFNNQFTFNPVNFNFNLPKGEYTLVTVETLVSDKTKKSGIWSLINTKSLKDLAISQNVAEVYYPYVIGTNTTSVSINGEEKMLSITPGAIGSLFQMYFFNFGKSTHVKAGFVTDDLLNRYKLNPSLSEDERYYYDGSRKGYMNVRGEVDVDASESSQRCTRYMLESQIDYKFEFQKKENEGTSTWTYYNANKGGMKLETGKTYYTGFYYVDDENVPAHYVGTLDGLNSWLNAIGTSSKLVPDVYQTWGGSVSTVQSFMSAYTMTLGSAGKAQAVDGGAYSIKYKGMGKESRIEYFFTSSTTGLYESDIYYKKGDVTRDELYNYLDKNYTLVNSVDDTYLFVTSDSKTYVLFITTDDGWGVGYLDVNSVSTSANKLSETKSFFAKKALQLRLIK